MESALRKTAPTNLEIIETLRFNPEEGFLRLPAHIDRLEKTCSELLYPFDRGAILMALGDRDSNTTRWRLSFHHDIILQVFLVMLCAPIVLRADASFAICIADRALSATVDNRATVWTPDLNVFVISIIYGSWSEFNAIERLIFTRVATVRSTFQCRLWLW